MASPLERLDSIRDSLVNSGLGGSGLTRQAIQRANLPQLNEELATSRATRASQARQRTLPQQTNNGLRRGSAGGAGAQATGGPSAIFTGQASPTGGDIFGLTFQTAGGNKRTVQGRLDKILAEAKKAQESGINVFGTEIDPNVLGRSGKTIKEAGISLIGGPEAEQLFLGRRRRGAFQQIGKGVGNISLNRAERVARAQEKETGRLIAQDADLLGGL